MQKAINSNTELSVNICTFLLYLLLIRRTPSSGILRRVALLRTDLSVELSASIIRVTRIAEPGTTLAVTSNLYFFLAWVGC
jgi:hypothetical protein